MKTVSHAVSSSATRYFLGAKSHALNHVISLLGAAMLMCPANLSFAQSTPPAPSFTGGGEISQVTSYEPAMVQFGSALYLIYPSSAHGNALYASPNTAGGLGFSNPGNLITSTSVTTGPAAAVYNNQLYVAWNSGGTIYITSSSNGSTWSSPTAITISPNPGISASYKPGLAAFGGSLWVAFVDSAGTEIAVASSTNGVNFSNTNELVFNYPPTSAPALAVYNNILWAVYTTSSYHTPVISQSSTGSGWVGIIDDAFEIGDNPIAVNYNSALYFGGNANYTERNLWLAGTYDGNTFSAATKYGQTLSHSPALATFNGALYECARSNYGSNIWCYYN